MDFCYVQSCPTCGAPVELDEGDRVVTCPYCDGRNYLVQTGVSRFTLPYTLPSEKSGDDVISFPYLRFTGHIYTCQGKELSYKILDTTQLGSQAAELPPSLGLRPQAMKLLPLSSHVDGRFLRISKKVKDIFLQAAKLTDAFSERDGQLYHRSFIGESVSVIYLPTYLDQESLVDGVLKRTILTKFNENDIEDAFSQYNEAWQPQFIPLLCPHCGARLSGAADSLVLHCNNCVALWRERDGYFQRLSWNVVPGEGDAYLPFWKMQIQFQGIELRSYADLLRITNHPVVIRKSHEQCALTFWIPGFKIRPRHFLKIAKNLSFSQLQIPTGNADVMKSLYPVTLPVTEARQAVKTVLSFCVLNKKKFFPRIPEIKTRVQGWELVYLPFIEKAGDFVQSHTGCVVNKTLLRFGRTM